jgi:triacylglycerol lipase
LKHLDRTSLDIFRAIEPLGTTLTPEMVQATYAVYAEIVEEPAEDEYRIVRDEAYGPDPRHRLDVFAPAQGGDDPRPVLLFVHGGGFVRGDKGGPEDPFYSNVGTWAVRRGFIGVNMTYRLAPAAQWPAGAEDVARAHAWVIEHIGRCGGDPRRVVILGHSAGAVHVAGYLAGHHGAPLANPPAGAVLLSGHYDLTRFEHTPFETQYFGADAARLPAQSSLEGLLTTSVPLLFGVAELEPAQFHQQAAQLVQTWLERKGAFPRLLNFPGHNHLSSILQLGAQGDTLGRDLAHFVIRCTVD